MDLHDFAGWFVVATLSGQSPLMTRLGTQDGDPLVVDLTGVTIHSWTELWDALATRCGLPEWFGRNLNAWWDTIDEGAIAGAIDAHPTMIVRLRRVGMFEPGDTGGEAFIEVTTRSEYASVEIT
jgi:hypothetical protein